MSTNPTNLSGTRVAVLSTHGFEDSELTSPVESARAAGATVEIIAPANYADSATTPGHITGKNGTDVEVNKHTDQVSAADYDALILPGGTLNADKLRMDAPAVQIVKELVDAAKPTAVICHGGWILTDADVLTGRTITSYPSIKTDLKNAGATWVDEEVHDDNGLVSSRTPADLPAFNAAMLDAFSR